MRSKPLRGVFRSRYLECYLEKGRVLEGYFSCIFESGFLEYLRMYFGMRAVQRAVQCISVKYGSNIRRSEQ